jgi:hypothetical protein
MSIETVGELIKVLADYTPDTPIILVGNDGAMDLLSKVIYNDTREVLYFCTLVVTERDKKEYINRVLIRVLYAIDRLKIDPTKPMSSQELIGWESCRRQAIFEVQRIQRDFNPIRHDVPRGWL